MLFLRLPAFNAFQQVTLYTAEQDTAGIEGNEKQAHRTKKAAEHIRARRRTAHALTPGGMGDPRELFVYLFVVGSPYYVIN